MLKIVMIGIMAVIFALFIGKDKPEFGVFITLGAGILILMLATGKMQTIVGVIRDLENDLGSGSMYIGILLKMVGITYVAEFGANLCRDAGYGSVAAQIEFYGKLMLLTVSVPLLVTLIDTIKEF